jgi:hypothetical protein
MTPPWQDPCSLEGWEGYAEDLSEFYKKILSMGDDPETQTFAHIEPTEVPEMLRYLDFVGFNDIKVRAPRSYYDEPAKWILWCIGEALREALRFYDDDPELPELLRAIGRRFTLILQEHPDFCPEFNLDLLWEEYRDDLAWFVFSEKAEKEKKIYFIHFYTKGITIP